jgi:hypothetical protein
MMRPLDEIRQRTWDFALTIATIVLLGGLGVQSFLGMLYTWWSIRTVQGWEQGAGYVAYVGTMNAIAAPQVVALVVVMGLCVPKRLFTRSYLVGVSAVMVAAGLATGLLTRSLSMGLAAYLILASFIQLAVVVLTIADADELSFLTQGRLTTIGSGLLHLGFVLFGIVVVALQKSPAMLPVFWASAGLVLGGTTLSFFAEPISNALPRTASTGSDETTDETSEPPECSEATAEASEPPATPDESCS